MKVSTRAITNVLIVMAVTAATMFLVNHITPVRRFVRGIKTPPAAA